MERIRVLNSRFDNCTLEEAVRAVDRMARGKEPCYVVTPNLDHLLNMDEDPEFYQASQAADLVLADGISVLWLARLMGTPLRAKVSGSDLFPRVCAMAARKGYSIYLLGAAPGVAELAASKLTKAYPALTVAGCYAPPLGFEDDDDEILRILEKVRTARPDILFIAISQMKGEKFIHRYRNQLGVPVTLSVGAAVDFTAGVKKRAPAWMSSLGLEWLYRTFQEPRRIGGRVLRDLRGLLPLIRKYRHTEGL